MVRESTRRNSARHVSYSYKEAFKDLELSGSELEAEEQDAGEVDEEEPEDFVPPAEEDEDVDEFMDDAAEEDEDGGGEEDEDGDQDVGTPARKKLKIGGGGWARRRESTATEARMRNGSGNGKVPATPPRTAKGSLRTSGISGVRCVGTPGVAGARFVALSTKATGASAARQRAGGDWREGGHESRLKNLFGPANEDLRPVFETKKRWLSQETLPSRAQKHLAPSPYVPEGAREKDTKALREWYTGSGRAAFARGQRTEEKSGDEAKEYLVNDGPEELNLLMGSLDNQHIYTLEKGQYMSAAAPFGLKSKRKGWIFHLGSRIQDAQWAPNEQGSTQYLAVTVEQKDPAWKKYKHLANPKAPAFTKTNPYPASIQIWAFGSTPDGSLDPKKEPRLVNVICADWGAPKAIKWWPIASKDSVDNDKDGVLNLGLLASIWSDGNVRVLDISFKQHSETQYIHYTKAALELAFYDPPPDDPTEKQKEQNLSTLPTCLTWLSPTTLAVGTASGIVAIWTLTRPGTFLSSSDSQPRVPHPWFHKQLADTYILTLTSAAPSHPHFLSLTTADGFARLIDLRTPLADAIASPRGRMMIPTQAWHEHTQSFVMVDEYYMLKHATLRRFHQAIYTFRAEATLTAVATSVVHAGILVGTADGGVTGTGGVGRLLNSKEPLWGQVWFRAEWRAAVSNPPSAPPAPPANGDGTAEAASARQPDAATFAGPLARISEGYKPTLTGIVAADSKRPKDGARFISSFEENSTVTRVVWNPNLKFGTWAVAGMQSGMLRVEDLGV
ncbi:hypothetical protein BU23DRAFT_563974 [Bimuria novae-zelandiae CBS 107.79]|uniref:Transcription factor TFIIIC complex subunit Tfc6 n=1 Tax=Bimuria novae-zelandiae CBS 107.79 TaxID=1447943 RepID=A0A6A5VM65_9PLEO|nr:hypothetical protein BU23DRAFT_563974 [Bimuria novae-zelandiae CBS 107.79]